MLFRVQAARATNCTVLAAMCLSAAAKAQEPVVQTSDLVEEIVVTAQKREQNLQDVSIAVSALSADELTRANITNIGDLGARIPNISVGTSFGQAQFFIRGIGLDNNFTGADPSVALHEDGAVISQSAAQLGAFLDLDRVEVLRGPQGTLYGRNATGGAINLITAKPTADVSGYVRGTYGDYDLMIYEGALSGPIAGESVRGRIALRSEDRSGFGRNEFTGQQIDDAKKRSARVQLQLLPSDDLSILLSGSWHREDDAAYSFKFKEISFPDNPDRVPAASGGFASGARDVRSEGIIRNDRETWALTGTLDWTLSANVTLRSISNYRDYEVDPLQDLDVSSIATPNRQNNYVSGDQFSEELQLQYDGDRLHGLVAAYYFKEELFGDNSVGLNPDRNLSPELRSFLVSFAGSVDIESRALFGQMTYNWTDQLALTVGARFTREDRQGDSLFKNPAAPAGIPFRTGGDFDDFSPRVTLEWRPREDVMLYGTYSEGFKSGIILTGQINPILEPEMVENYEIGLKSRLFERTFGFNLSAFHENFTDLQVGTTSPSPGPAGFTTIFENAASATIDGAELEIDWYTPLRGFTVGATAGYLDARFDEYNSADPLDFPVATKSLAGNRLTQSPKWTAAARTAYEIVLAGGASITLHADVDYKSDMYFSAFNQERVSQSERTLYNANVEYVSADGRVYINLWGKNLSDELVYAGIIPLSTTRTIVATYAPPRTYGLTVGFKF